MDPSTLTLGAVLENVSKLTVAGGLATILFLSYRGVWIWGSFHKEAVREINERHAKEVADLKADRDEWKAEAKLLSRTTLKSVTTAETIAATSGEKK